MINAVIFGSTGMIGKGVLLESLMSAEVESVLVINRRPCGIDHPKLREILHDDLFDLSAVKADFRKYNACFFCAGVSAAGLSEKEYHRITFEMTMSVAKTLAGINREMTFCYVSGAGTDSSEKGRMMWARVKGKTENALRALPFKRVYLFRPGFIQPMKGIRSKTRGYNLFYSVLRPLYFMLKHLKTIVTNTEILGRSMIYVAAYGHDGDILNSSDINCAGKEKL